MDDDESIDFNALETELCAAIEADAKYRRENDAKFRAIKQRVATYDEFRSIVEASHLKPLDKTDLHNPLKKTNIWNSIASKKKQQLPFGNSSVQNCPQTMIKADGDQLPATVVEFEKKWRVLDVNDRLNLVKKMGVELVGQLLQPEIPVGVLGDIIQAVLPFESNTPDIVFVARLLEELSKAKRFILSLQFLSSEEKAACKELMDKLDSSFQNRQQDLAEEGITEWTVLELKNTYKI